jgi:hypothetical protein
LNSKEKRSRNIKKKEQGVATLPRILKSKKQIKKKDQGVATLPSTLKV